METAPDKKRNAATATAIPLRRQAETEETDRDFIAGYIDD
jgi:hypothetical protein